MKFKNSFTLLALFICSLFFSGCGGQATSSNLNSSSETSNVTTQTDVNRTGYKFSYQDVPQYKGKPYIELNGNVPNFEGVDVTKSFESYSDLDSFGRCGVAFANVGKELMPTEKRGKIGMIKPSGWQTARYDDLIKDKYLYNRCHLIAFMLAGENANEKNLITGTRYLNIEGMLPFEERVKKYVDKTGNHVLYRVTPIFVGDELVARGVQMEAQSVEDNGKGIQFNVFCYNVQPKIEIDYATGNSKRKE